jgi:nucleoside phosphorylase
MEDRVEVFIAFDKEDGIFLRELKKHLKPLEMQGLIIVWDVSKIIGGTDRKQAIDEHLKTASIILLLVSANFIAAPEANTLTKQAIAKKAYSRVYIVPVLLSEVAWEYSDFGEFAPLPSNKKPIASWSNRNEAYVNVVEGIREIVFALRAPLLLDQLNSSAVTIKSNQDQEPLVKGNVEVHAYNDGRLVLDSDHLEYSIEDQPWYVSNFPQVIEIEQKQIDTIKREIDIVMITATEVEMKAVMRLIRPYPRRKSILLAFLGPETYYLGKFGAYNVVVTKCRMGSIGEGSIILAANQAQEMWRPKAIIMVGIAFGKDAAKQKIADVLVASQIIPYERMRVGEQKVLFRDPIPPSNATLLNRFENASGWHFERPDGKQCALLVGPILSGEKLVDNLELKQHLFQQFPQAIGGEMEGAGLCAVSGRLGVAWILVKAICDWGDGKKQKQHQPLAAAAAVSLVHYVLSQKNVLHSMKKM